MLARNNSGLILQSAIRNPQSPQSGFTLVEILIVIVVIGMLLALLLPAVNNARRRAQETRVTAEIKQLESAVVAFKTEFGVEPPSRFVICLTQAAWNLPANAESKAVVRRIWPQFDFTMAGGPPTGNDVAYPASWATTAGASNQIGIAAGECLLFFLGGVIDANRAPTGFSKNPTQPFSPSGTSRKGPFMEFDISRIRDSDIPNNGMNEYFDPLPDRTNPYLYFSSYEGRAYRTLTNVHGSIDLPADSPTAPTTYTLIHDVYRQYNGTTTPNAPPAAPNITATAAASTSAAYTPFKAQSFQIISPGYDNDYGVGGAFNPNLPNGGLTNTFDYDNLTNFHSGRLSP